MTYIMSLYFQFQFFGLYNLGCTANISQLPKMHSYSLQLLSHRRDVTLPNVYTYSGSKTPQISIFNTTPSPLR